MLQPSPTIVLGVNQAVDCHLAPTNGTTPVTLTDIHWYSGHSGITVTPSADGLTCRVAKALDADPSTVIGQEVQITATGGGLVEWKTFRIVDAVTVTAPTVTSLGLTVGDPFVL